MVLIWSAPWTAIVLGAWGAVVKSLVHRQARKAAKKYNLDFSIRCVFPHQVKQVGIGFAGGRGEMVRVCMESGKVGLYRCQLRDDTYYGGTGQHDYHYEFQEYAE